MICAKCGSEVPDDAEFCPHCGAPASLRSADGEGDAPKPKRGPGKGVIIAICLAVAAVVVAGVVWWRADQQSKATAIAHSQHAITIGITAPSYVDATSSKIPVHLTGVDVDGNNVDKIAFVNGEGEGISVTQGSYQLKVAASPILADGTIYTTPTNEIDFSVDSSAKDEESFDISSQNSFAFTIPDADTVTDDQISAAADYASKGGVDDAATATQLKTAATKKRDDAVAAKKQAAADADAAAKADAAAAEKSKYHVVANHYEFDIPDYWRDKVTWTVDGDTVTVYPDLYQMPLVTLAVTGSVDAMGDIGTSIIWYSNCSAGVVTATETRYAYVCTHENFSDTMADALIDLQTGGRVTYAQALRAKEQETSGGSAGMSQIFMAGDGYFTDSIAPSIVLK